MTEDFNAEAFGATIASTRRLRRMSLEEVGSAAGLTKSHVWELETGRAKNPTVRAVWGLSRALGITPANLLGFNPDELALHHTAMEVACLVDRAIRAEKTSCNAERAEA